MSMIRRSILTTALSLTFATLAVAATTPSNSGGQSSSADSIQTILGAIEKFVENIAGSTYKTEQLTRKGIVLHPETSNGLSQLFTSQVAYAAAKQRLPAIQTQVNAAIQTNTLLTKDQKDTIYNAQQKGQMLSNQGLALILNPNTSFTLSSPDGQEAALGYSVASNPENNGIQGLTGDEVKQISQNDPKYVMYYNVLQTANQNFNTYRNFLTNQLVDHIQYTGQNGNGPQQDSVTQAESNLLGQASNVSDFLADISKGNIPGAMLLIGTKIISILNLIPQLVENTKMMVMFSAMTENTMNTMSLMMAKSVLTNPATLGMGTKIEPAPLSPAS